MEGRWLVRWCKWKVGGWSSELNYEKRIKVWIGFATFEANDHPTSSRRVLRLGSVHRHSSLHSHFRAKFGHEKVVLGTPIYIWSQKSSQERFWILIPKPLAHCIHNQNKKRLGLKMASCISAFTLTLKPFKLIFIIDCFEFFTSILAMATSRDFLISIKEWLENRNMTKCTSQNQDIFLCLA